MASLFKCLTKPAQPGYRKVSLRQILRADKLAFAKMSEAGEDIRADASGALPLDQMIASISDNAPYKGQNGKGRGYWGARGLDSWYNKGKNSPKGKDLSGQGKGCGGGKSEWLPEGLRYQE